MSGLTLAQQLLRLGATAVALSGLGLAARAAVEVPAAVLQDQYTRLRGPLQRNAFGRPLVLQSVQTQDALRGDIYAVLDYSITHVAAGLRQPGQWCEVMILHINTKYCRAAVGPQGTVLHVNIGKKTQQPLADSTRVDFLFSELDATDTFFAISLRAQDGPLSTHDYRIRFEAVALPSHQTFLHFSYAYGVGFAGKIAMQSYLVSLGVNKVGFTTVGQAANGQTRLIGGVRGVVERNAMRYFLAIESYLAAMSAAPSVQLEQRLQAWFTATERYPRQLHEIDRAVYLEMKRAEHARQRAVL